MERILTFLMLSIIFGACSSNNDEPDKEPLKYSFRSHNIKTGGKQYFTFLDNTGTTEEPATWDIAFGSVPLTVETSPCNFFTMPFDPVIFAAADISIARIDAKSLDEITTVPGSSLFKKDIPEGNPVIGKAWIDQNNSIKLDVYAVKTCSGNYGIMQLKSYSYDPVKHQIYDIKFEYKYNNDGSTDFSLAPKNDVTIPDANQDKQYFSFEKGVVTGHDSYDLKFDGHTIWLGAKANAIKMENINIDDVTTIADNNFKSDEIPSYVTGDWYNYGDAHVITPKDLVFVVNTPDGKYPAFEITNYYDEQGNSGTFSIQWKYLKD